MKKVTKIIIWLLGIFTVIFISLSIIIIISGKKIIVKGIEENLKIKAGLESIELGLPLTVSLKNLELEKLAKFERISFTPNLLGLFAGKVVLSGLTMINPQINLVKYPDGSLNLPKLEQKAKAPPVLLTGLTIRNGRLVYCDQTILREGFKTILTQVNFRISRVIFPLVSLNTKFDFSSIFTDTDGKTLGSLRGAGWLDFLAKSADANFEIENLELAYFRPYYGNFLSEKKLLSAKLQLVQDLKAKNNDLTILSKFRLSSLIYLKEQPQREGELPNLDLMKKTLDLFTDKNGNLDLEFTIKTKLDHPNLSIGQLKKVILEAAMKNLTQQRPDELMEKIHQTVKEFEEFGKQMKDLFKKKN